MKNVMFIHAGNVPYDKSGMPNTNRCQNILNDISDHIIESKIYEHLDSIFLEVVGTNDLIFDIPKSKITHNGNDIRQFEFPTL